MRTRFLCSLLIAVLGLLCLAVGAVRMDGGQAGTRLTLTLPELSWALEITAPGFVVQEKQFNKRGDGIMLMAVNSKTQVILSAFLEKAAKDGDAKACRDHYWGLTREAPMAMKDVRMYESGPMAIVEYDISPGGKATISQKNAHAYLAVGGYWIDVHLSQISLNPKAGDPFASVLERIRINESYLPTAQEHLGYASAYYLRKDYAKAARHYEEVLNRQASERTLDHDTWRVVIDQLGMSYGLSGQPGKTRDLLQWAIPVDPEYPMFYYNLACAFAELGDAGQALSNLQLAYGCKQNMLPNETFPDPKKDPSFKKLLKDEKFRAALDKLK